MLKVKICGITNKKDALLAADFGAWAIGFIFYKKSPRYIGPLQVKQIVRNLPPFVTPVAVFVNEKETLIKNIASFCGIKTLQLHGDESPSFCKQFKSYKIIKAFRVNENIVMREILKYPVDAYLFDSYGKNQYGGTGKTFNWNLIKEGKRIGIPVILSGGLNSLNIEKAVKAVRPYAIDVSSGIEIRPGEKDKILMQDLFKKISKIS